MNGFVKFLVKFLIFFWCVLRSVFSLLLTFRLSSLTKICQSKLLNFCLICKLKSELLHLANSYVHNYKPPRSTLRKHGILKKLKSNESIVILQPDKGNGVVVLDRTHYDNAIKEIRGRSLVVSNLRQENKASRFESGC